MNILGLEFALILPKKCLANIQSQALNGSMSLEGITIKSMKNELKENVIVAISHLIKTLSKTVVPTRTRTRPLSMSMGSTTMEILE